MPTGESLNMSYLSPYLEAVGSDFTGGANFAISGSTTLPRNVPFALHVQVQQFLHLKQRSLELIAHGGTAPVDADGFRNALYLIDIGQNDLSAAFGSGAPYDDIVHQRIPAIVSEIKDAIMVLLCSAVLLLCFSIGFYSCFSSSLSANQIKFD